MCSLTGLTIILVFHPGGRGLAGLEIGLYFKVMICAYYLSSRAEAHRGHLFFFFFFLPLASFSFRAKNRSSIHQLWSSKSRNSFEPTSAPAGAKIIACHTQTRGIICTAEGIAWCGREEEEEEQEVQWQADKMWLYAIIFEISQFSCS